MIEGMENQCLGTNAKAQEILKAQIDEFFPALNAAAEVSDEIVNKYYDWIFPYIWTDDGGQERRWASAVRSLCRRHAKLAALEEYFAANDTDATQNEKYGGTDTLTRTGDDTAKNSGTDNVKFTDNRKQRTTVTFRGVGAPTSSANTADTTETELGAGANDTDTQTTHGKTTTTTHDTQDTTTYGKTRTWTDGRTWTQVLADVWAATSPVYDFVNAFAQILLSPDTVCVIWEPTMSMTADAEKLAPGSQPTATIVNVGTATHPRWELHLGLVTGDTGATPEITVTASVDDNVGTPEVTVTQTGTPEHPDIDFAFKNMKGETGETGATPDITMTATVDGTTGTPSVQVTESGTPEAPTFNLAFSGLKGEGGGGSMAGKYLHMVTICVASQSNNAVFNIFVISEIAEDQTATNVRLGAVLNGELYGKSFPCRGRFNSSTGGELFRAIFSEASASYPTLKLYFCPANSADSRTGYVSFGLSSNFADVFDSVVAL